MELVIAPPPADIDLTQPFQCVNSWNGVIPESLIPVGRSWEAKARKEAGIEITQPTSATEELKSPVSAGLGAERGKYERLRDKHIELDDYYGLLGLDPFDEDLTEEKIRHAHRAVSLFCHPDKAPPAKRAEVEERFKATMFGFDILLDPKKRIRYDSSRPFDEDIPDVDEGLGKDFYEAYGPVFQRNAWFSSTKPVPLLEGDSASDEHVDNFYDFWLSFKSWRDFDFKGEHNPDNATSRDEKRWMQRENATKTKKFKAADVARVRKLTEDAMGKDPRVKRKRAADLKAKEDAKKAKQNDKKEKADAIERVKKEAEDAAERQRILLRDQARDEAERKKKVRNMTNRIRKELKTVLISGDLGQKYDELDCDIQLAKLEYDQLSPLFFQMQPNSKLIPLLQALNDPAPTDLASPKQDPSPEVPMTDEQKAASREAFEKIVATLKARDMGNQNEAEERKAREAFERKKAEEEEAKRKVWSLEEMSLLAKAVNKFPSGLPERWQRITEAVNINGGSRTMKEVISQVREFDSQLKKMSKEDAFKQYQSYRHQHEKPGAEAALDAPTIPEPIVAAVEKPAEKPTKAEKPVKTPEKKAPEPAAVKADKQPAKQAEKKADKPATTATKIEKPAATPAAKADAAPAKEKKADKAKAGKEADKPAKEADKPAKETKAAPEKPKEVKAEKPVKEAKAEKPMKEKEVKAVEKVAAKQAEVAPKDDGKKKQGKKEAAGAGGASGEKTAKANGEKTAKATAEKPAKVSAEKPADKPAPVAAAAPQASEESDEEAPWTAEQQACFESALKQVSKDEANRWDMIAALVPGKNKKDCVGRFKAIRAALMKQKQQKP